MGREHQLTLTKLSAVREKSRITGNFWYFPKSLLCSAIFALTTFGESELKKVSFYTDTVAEVEDGIIKLMMGSIWVMDSPVLALQSQEIVITFNQPAPILDSENVSKWEETLPRNGVLYQGELKVNVHRVSGVFLPLDGFYGNVVKKSANGEILKTDDGSIWHVDSLDMYDSQYWSTPYPVVMDSYKSYIINLKESKRIKMAKKKVPLH